MWAVILLPENRYDYAYPFTDEATAHKFATFLSEEVDNARVIQLLDPAEALLTWREHTQAKQDERAETPTEMWNFAVHLPVDAVAEVSAAIERVPGVELYRSWELLAEQTRTTGGGS